MKTASEKMNQGSSSAVDLNPYYADIIVIGNGPVGVHFVNQIIKLNPAIKVCVFGAEPYQPYDRVKLSSLLAGEVGVMDIDNPIPEPSDHLEYFFNCPIIDVDVESSCVKDHVGRVYHFGSLIFATGSRPHIPNIEGVKLNGVYTFRDLRDTERLQARNVRSRHTVVLGGGLLGLEAARAMLKMNTKVSVVQQSNRLMNRQLDESASEILSQHMLDLGINIYTSSGVREIIGDREVKQVVLRNKETIECDTVIVAAGITPNIELARKAGIAVGRGIKVNQHLQTSKPNVYAIGECAEFNQQIYGLIAPGLEQSSVAAHVLTKQFAEYKGSINATQLKVVGVSIFSMGDVGEGPLRPFEQRLVYEDEETGCYRKIIIHRGVLVGAISVGQWNEVNRVREYITFKKRLMPWQWLRFKYQGNLWTEEETQNVRGWPEETIVCHCRQVDRGTLSQAQQQPVCVTIEDLSNITGAGKVCGSCKPLLANLMDAPVENVVVKGAKILLGVSVLAAILSIFYFFFPPIESPVTWTKNHISQLWNDGFNKQVTGFSLLGLSVIGGLISARKRILKFNWGEFNYWRIFHGVLGIVSVLVLFTHTGFSLGVNLNWMLAIDFLLILVLGAIAGLWISQESAVSGAAVRRWRKTWVWIHILCVWPLPVLLGFHILSVYYF